MQGYDRVYDLKMANIKPLVFTLLIVGIVSAQNKCCSQGENVVYKKLCKNGSNITGITCDRMYMIESEDDKFDIDSNGTLHDEYVEISMEEYCLTKTNESENVIALICMIDDLSTDESDFFYISRATCAVISVVFLVMTMIVYILVPNLRDLQGKCTMHSVSALAIAMFFLCIMQFGLQFPEGACEVVGYITFMAFMATFTWLNTVSFHIWRTTVIPSVHATTKQWYLTYLIYAYGVPLVMLTAALAAHHAPGNHIKPGIGNNFCWFQSNRAIWAYFYGPILVLLIINIIFFCWTIKKLWKDCGTVHNSSSKIKSLKYKCLLYVKLFFIMGLSWIFEVLSFAFDYKEHFIRYVWHVTDFINSMQGVLIFLILIVFRKRALRGLAKRGLCCIRLPTQWKTLQDEECEELFEEKEFSMENHPEEQLYKQKDVNSTS